MLEVPGNPATEPKARRQVGKDKSRFVGMDVRNKPIDIAIAASGREGQLRHVDASDGSLAALDKVVRKMFSNGQRPCFAYEAGP